MPIKDNNTKAANTEFFFKQPKKPRKKPNKRLAFFLERPRVLKYPRAFKRTIKNKAISHRTLTGTLKTGSIGFKALTTCRLAISQIESVRKFVIKHYKKKKLKIVFNVTFDNPLTKKGLGVRMGKGKGKLNSFVCSLVPGHIFLELDGFTKKDAWKAKFIFRHVFERLSFKSVNAHRL